jgi:hypothetical protein
MNVQRFVLTSSGLAAGTYCAYAAWRFNVAMARGDDGYVFATVMAALTVGCWALLPIAVEKWREGAKTQATGWACGWAVIMALVLANSAGFTAGGRREAVTGKSVAIEAYERAQQARKQASDGLAAAMAAGRWKEVDRFRTSIESAETTLAKGRPGASDAQADLLSMLTGFKVETVESVLPIANTIILEFAANLLLLAAATTRQPIKSETVEPVEVIERRRPRPRLVVKNEPERPVDPAMTQAMAAIRSKMAKLA